MEGRKRKALTMNKTCIYLMTGVLLLLFSRCGLLEFDLQPKMVVTAKYIAKVRTGEYRWIYSETIPGDATAVFDTKGQYYCYVPVYENCLVSKIENIGSDSAGDIEGYVTLYNKDCLVAHFYIYYTSILYPGGKITNTIEVDILECDSIEIELSYYDADTEDSEEESGCY
jgi:hypothetical protein